MHYVNNYTFMNNLVSYLAISYNFFFFINISILQFLQPEKFRVSVFTHSQKQIGVYMEVGELI